ncbi:MAG: SPOR domain-containing protein [Sphingomicrobium sp.]
MSEGYDEQLPWLQAVEDEDEPRGVSARKMLAAVALVLLAGVLVAGTFFWLGRDSSGGDGQPQPIHADARPYKIKPADPGGLDVAGESQTAFETSAGEDKDSKLDFNALPETAIAKRPAAQPTPGAPAESKVIAPSETKLAAPKPPAPKPEPKPAEIQAAATGTVVQLGAFANQAQAERAWTALSARFPAVAAMGKMIVPFTGGIRLRAGASSPAEARQACQTLKAAGENCFLAH